VKRAKVRMAQVEAVYRMLKFVIEGLLCIGSAPEPCGSTGFSNWVGRVTSSREPTLRNELRN